MPSLPLFPLGSVLFPGLLLPLQVFEPRYQALVEDLRLQPEHQREFGVVAIRLGHEVGAASVAALHPVGCTALVQDITPLPDGRSRLVTVGHRRFRLDALEPAGTPYLMGEVTWIEADPASTTPDPQLLGAVRRGYLAYRELLGGAQPTTSSVPQLPEDPEVLSYLVSAALVLDLAEQQALLEGPDTTARLRLLRALLHRELGLISVLRALPAPELARSGVVAN